MSQDRARAARYVTTRRGELGLTQQQLAILAEVDIKTIYNLESGERWPQARNRVKIEAALGLPAGTLDALAAGRNPEQRSIGELLDEGRKQRQLTRQEAAALTGVTLAQWLALVAGSAAVEEAFLVARAAMTVHLTPAQIAGAGRKDAAEVMENEIKRVQATQEKAKATEAAMVERRYDDPGLQRLWDIEELSKHERLAAITLIEALRKTAATTSERGEGARRASGL